MPGLESRPAGHKILLAATSMLVTDAVVSIPSHF